MYNGTIDTVTSALSVREKPQNAQKPTAGWASGIVASH
jgi:hypothetical protein